MKKQILLVLSFCGIMTFAQNAKSSDVNTPREPVVMKAPDKPVTNLQAYYDASNMQSLSNPELYRQILGTTDNISSQQFEAANTIYNSMAADDFEVPSGVVWNISDVYVSGTGAAVYPTSFNVSFYTNSGSNLPGTLVRTENVVLTAGANSPTLPLATTLSLGAGKYWLSVQAVLDFTGGGQWFWNTYNGGTLGAPFAWQNPGGGFATSCTTWNTASICLTGQQPDLQFALNGTVSSAVCKTFTGRILTTDPTQSPRIFRDGTPSVCGSPKTYPGTTSSGNFHYKTHGITNTAATSQCVTFTLNNADTNFVHLVAYSGTFDPTNIGLNYLGDTGTSSSGSSGPVTMSVDVPAGATIVLVASEVVVNTAFTADYTIDVSAPNCGAILRTGETGGKEAVNLFPNPTSGTLFVSGMNVQQAKVVDVSGKMFPVQNTGNQINVEKLTKGNYILQLKDKNGNTHSNKFIKK